MRSDREKAELGSGHPLRLGLLVPPFAGHLRPMSALGRALEQLGHHVTVLSPPDGVRRARQLGMGAVPFGAQHFPEGEWERRALAMGRAEGRDIYRQAYRLLVEFARAIADDLSPRLREQRLDGLVMDQLCYAAESVAEATGTPLAVACNALPMHRESRVPLCTRPWPYCPALWARIRNRLDGAMSLLAGWRMSLLYLRHRRRLGLRPPRLSDLNEIPPSLVHVAQIPEWLDFPRRALPDHFHHTAPWLLGPGAEMDTFPWDRLDGRPLIYASLGTLQNGVGRHFEVIGRAASELDVQLVVSLGRDAADPPCIPGKPVVVTYAPQRRLLERCSLLVTHAGLNTVLEGLTVGVPMVAVPVGHEQPANAARLERFGAAISLPMGGATAERLRWAMQTCLEDGSYRACARAAAERLRTMDGPRMAAGLIERAFRERRPVTRAPRR